MKIILAKNLDDARKFCAEHNLWTMLPDPVILVDSVRSIEGLRFRYEEVIRVPGWSTRPDIEEIEDRILRTHVIMSPKKVD